MKKLYTVIRKDLGMSKGKIVAQSGHAIFLLALRNDVEDNGIIALKADTEGDLLHVLYMCHADEILHVVIRDAGRTEVPEGTLTCLAFYHENTDFCGDLVKLL